jgi:hypothetical protein
MDMNASVGPPLLAMLNPACYVARHHVIHGLYFSPPESLPDNTAEFGACVLYRWNIECDGSSGVKLLLGERSLVDRVTSVLKFFLENNYGDISKCRTLNMKKPLPRLLVKTFVSSLDGDMSYENVRDTYFRLVNVMRESVQNSKKCPLLISRDFHPENLPKKVHSKKVKRKSKGQH